MSYAGKIGDIPVKCDATERFSDQAQDIAAEADAEIARLRAVAERLRSAHQEIVDDHAYCEKQGGSQFGDRAPAYAETSRKALEGTE